MSLFKSLLEPFSQDYNRVSQSGCYGHKYCQGFSLNSNLGGANV